MQWLNKPAQWAQSDRRLTVKTDAKTDFWRVTHYGFIRDSGHFYFDTVASDFTVNVKVRGSYQDLYDQAGIMIRADENHWIKAGIEYVDGIQNLSAVVTHNYSDWSVTPLLHPPDVLHLRVERRQEAIQLFYLDEAGSYRMFRMTYLPGEELQVGVMCASPDGSGFEVIFEDYQIQPEKP
jgi:uncharacterized protein